MSYFYEFADFRLYPEARMLHRQDREICVGSRAFDILLALVSSQGEVLSHRQLMQSAWPGLVVENSNIRVQVASLRRLLDCDRTGTRFITSVMGRGYCFAAPVNRLELRKHGGLPAAGEDAGRAEDVPHVRSRAPANSSLPRLAFGAVGRGPCVEELSRLVFENRLVTIVGSGGIGKTTTAVLTAHALRAFDSRVFVNLSDVHEEEMVLEAFASSLGYVSSQTAMLSGLVDVLSGQNTLIIVDNCEHVIESVVTICLRIVESGPGVHLLLTSREAMRVTGERVYVLKPLGFPPENLVVSLDDAERWPAMQLFVERAIASGGRHEMTDQDVVEVGSLCRRLDGNPLAIGLVASQVGVYGIRGVSELIASQYALHWQGARNAPLRHQSVEASINWTYALLSPRDRFVFSCLSVFAGAFSWSAAAKVIADEGLTEAQVMESLDELVNKFLVSVVEVDGRFWLKLLETTRAFAGARLEEDPSRPAVAQRHARYYADRLAASRLQEGGGAESMADSDDELLDIGNLRAAIEWGFANEGGRKLAAEMVCNAVPLFFDNLLIGECTRLCDRALRNVPVGCRSTRIELGLLESRAMAFSVVGQYDEGVIEVIARGIDLSRYLNDRRATLHLLAGLHLAMMGNGRFDASLRVARQYAEIAHGDGAGCERVVAGWMAGISHHFIGDLLEADAAFRASNEILKQGISAHVQYFDVKLRLNATMAMARVSWAMGRIGQAIQQASRAIAESRNYPDSFFPCATLCFPILLMAGERAECKRLVQEMNDISGEYKKGTRYLLPKLMEAQLCLELGQFETARKILFSCLYENPVLHTNPARMEGLRALSEAALKCGDWVAAGNAADEGLELSLATGQHFRRIDMMMAKARSQMAMPEPPYVEIDKLIGEAKAMAERQQALTWVHCVAETEMRLDQVRRAGLIRRGGCGSC